MDEKTQTHTKPLTFQQASQDLKQIKEELADIKACLKFIVLQRMIRDCSHDEMGIKDRIGIIRQLPNLSDYFFDVKRYAEDMGLRYKLSKRRLYNLGYTKKDIEEMVRIGFYPTTKKTKPLFP